MTTTRLHMSVTLLIALMLHVGIIMWFERPAPATFPERLVEPPAPTLLVSLLATINEEKTVSASAVIPEPILEPLLESVPEPEPVPDPLVEPVQQEMLPVEPPPETKPPQAVKIDPEPMQTPEPTPDPEITSPAPRESEIARQNSLALAQYSQLLRAWLEKHKVYPRNAQRQRIEGEGRLRILINRMGWIQQVALEHRTGNRLLDKAALKMAWLADPFPAMAETDLRQDFEFIVPVVFALR